MRISSWILASAPLFAGRVDLVAGCPFDNGGPIPEDHADVVRRTTLAGFFDPDGYLTGSPSRGNGVFGLAGITQAMDATGTTLADVVASQSRPGADLCLIRFQQLPPPATGRFEIDQNEVDRQSFLDLIDVMTQRFYDLVTPDGGVFFSGSTIGSRGARAMCDAGIDTDRFCDPRVLSQTLEWPQSITGYRVTNSTGTFRPKIA